MSLIIGKVLKEFKRFTIINGNVQKLRTYRPSSPRKSAPALSSGHESKDEGGWDFFSPKFGVPCLAVAFSGVAIYDSLDEKLPSTDEKKETLESKVYSIVERKFLENSLPGVSYIVVVDGKVAVSGGMGYSDIENNVSCSPSSVMRIASISKPITMAAAARLIEEGKLDIDAPVQKYVPNFPVKQFGGEDVTITTRHLMTHTSGIRHYTLKHDKPTKPVLEIDSYLPTGSDLDKVEQKRENLRKFLGDLSSLEDEKISEGLYDVGEVYIKEKFPSVQDSVKLFKDDELLFEPDTKFGYTTHGWTLVSAVIEGASKEKFSSLMKGTFKELKMENTHLETHSSIVPNRARQYTRDENGVLINARYVDNSYKYAGGGIVSNAKDLAMFGLQMLCSAQNLRGSFLAQRTMQNLWTPHAGANLSSTYGERTALGWFVEENRNGGPFIASHTGAAVGGSSILSIAVDENSIHSIQNSPKGIVVVLLTNIDNISFTETARSIIKTVLLFQKSGNENGVEPIPHLKKQLEGVI